MSSGRLWRDWPQSRAALASIVALIGLVPLGALTYLVEHDATDALRSEVRANLSNTTSLTATFLGRQLGGIEDLLVSYAEDPELVQALRAPDTADEHELDHVVADLLRSRTDVLNVAGIADVSGAMVASTVPQPADADFRDRPWFQGVLRTGQTYVSDALVGRSPGSPLAISIATPVRGRHGQIIAVFVVGYTLENLQTFVARLGDEQHIDVTVTDRIGTAIAQPGSAPNELSVLVDDERVSAALAGRSGTSEVGEGPGGGTLAAYAAVPRVGWAVVAEVPRGRAYAPVATMRSNMRVIAVSLALLIILGAILLSRALRARDVAVRRAQEHVAINTAVLNATQEAVTLVDLQGLPILRNARGRELGRSFGTHREDANLLDTMTGLASQMTDPETYSAELVALRADPDLEQSADFTIARADRSFHRYSGPVRDEGGELLGRLVVLRETTDERRARSAAHSAKEDADRANRAKSKFLSRMSHELRTPLNAILGFAQLLHTSDLPDDAGDHIEYIDHAGRHLLALINEVLDISRIEAGQVELSLEPVQLGELIEETIPMVLGLAEDVDVRLEVSVADDHWVYADRQRLKQVLLNLLTNAIKYNRRGGTVSVSSSVGAGMAQVRVRDGGLGIPENRLDDVFVPFNRLGADLSGVEGSGLGLSLSRALAEALDGTLVLESTSSEGSTFLLELRSTAPRMFVPDVPGRPVGEEPGNGLRPDVATGPHTVLYIEDNSANVALVRAALTSRPNVVLLAYADGTSGLRAAALDPPSMILLDLHLPGLGGDEVLVALKQDPRTADIPVVVLTADILSSDPSRLLAEGAAAFVTKPIEIARLLTMVDSILGDRESASLSPRPVP